MSFSTSKNILEVLWCIENLEKIVWLFVLELLQKPKPILSLILRENFSFPNLFIFFLIFPVLLKTIERFKF